MHTSLRSLLCEKRCGSETLVLGRWVHIENTLVMNTKHVLNGSTSAYFHFFFLNLTLVITSLPIKHWGLKTFSPFINHFVPIWYGFPFRFRE